MKLLEIFRFEIVHRLRRLSTWLYLGILFGIGVLILHAIDGGSSYVNAPVNVANLVILFGILGGMITAALCGDAATRDVQFGMDPLFYTAPITRVHYLGGRFLGAMAINAVLLVGLPVGLAVGSWLPYLDREMFGPFQPGAYVQSYLIFLLPSLLLTGAVLFTIAALTRSTIATYLGAIGIFLIYGLTDEFSDRMENQGLASLLDPFGLSVLDHRTAYWTPAELNHLAIPVDGLLLLNRLIWTVVALLILAFLYHRFRFAHPREARRERKSQPSEGHVRGEPVNPLEVPSATRTFGLATLLRQTLAVARRSFTETTRGRGFVAIVLGSLAWVFGFGWDVGGVVFGTSTWPVTRLVATTVLSGTFVVSVIFSLVIAVYAGELVWREREARINDIVDATPIPDWVGFLGKFLALALLLATLQAVLMVSGILLQAVRGYYEFEIGLYLRILFGLQLADYLLLAALAMLVHVLVDQKYLGHFVVLLFFLFTVFAGQLGLEHNLLVYGADPGWTYSDLSGFEPFLTPVLWFKLYWAGWALLFAVVANLFWVRGRQFGARTRMRAARVRFTGGAIGGAALAGAMIVTFGGFIFYNTNVLNDYRTSRDRAEQLAEYERRYRRYEETPQPKVIRSDLRVEIYPSRRAVELGGTYRLLNRTEEAVSSVHLLLDPDVAPRSIRFDRPAAAVLEDQEHGYRIFALESPLEPGDSLRLEFDLEFRSRGFPNRRANASVVRNGTYFDRRWLPVIGYQPDLELSDPRVRRDHGLPSRPPMPPVEDPVARQHGFTPRDADWVEFDAVIGTDADQVAIAPGSLRRSWTENGRRYFHYRADAPIANSYPFLSARYQVLQDEWNGVAIQIYHHPSHDFNLERMVRSIKASLEYNSRHFGRYPHRQIRIVEFPGHAGGFARSHPNTIAYSEASSFITRVEEGDVDRPFFVTAHEAAHQWWGNQIASANVQGAAVLTETLAQYSAMMVMEKTYGRDHVRRFLEYELDSYLRGRRVYTNREVPLLRVEDQRYIYYNKGALVMYALREYLGEDRVNTALRRFLESHRFVGPPYPTALDLYGELRAITPDSLQPLLVDLFEEITLWDLRMRDARVTATPDGEFRVTLDLEAFKVRADSVGNERSVPMDDLVEIGIFSRGVNRGDLGEPLYLGKHRVRSGRQSITIQVPAEPERAAIDPYHLLIDRRIDDNVLSGLSSR